MDRLKKSLKGGAKRLTEKTSQNVEKAVNKFIEGLTSSLVEEEYSEFYQTMKNLQKSSIVHTFLAISFFISGLIVNIIQLILYVTLRNYDKTLYRQINYYLAYSIYSQMVFLVAWWSYSDISIYVEREIYDQYFGKEHALFVSNHRYEIDWLIGCQISDYVGVLGNCKAYSKKSIQFLPVIGWAWKFGEYVFLERSFDKDREIISKQISELGDYPDPIWLTLFPEGTRFSPKKHQVSMEFAEKNGLPLLKHHLTPHTKGFVTSLKSMKGKINAIYDVTLAFKENETKPTMRNLILGDKLHAHLHVTRVPLSKIPDSEEGAAQWLRDSFVNKDKLMGSFLKTGDFFSKSGFKKIKPLKFIPRNYSLMNTVYWNIIILIPAFWYLQYFLFTGQFMYFILEISLFFGFNMLLNKVINASEINKGSNYGSQQEKVK